MHFLKCKVLPESISARQKWLQVWYLASENQEGKAESIQKEEEEFAMLCSCFAAAVQVPNFRPAAAAAVASSGDTVQLVWGK